MSAPGAHRSGGASTQDIVGVFAPQLGPAAGSDTDSGSDLDSKSYSDSDLDSESNSNSDSDSVFKTEGDVKQLSEYDIDSLKEQNNQLKVANAGLLIEIEELKDTLAAADQAEQPVTEEVAGPSGEAESPGGHRSGGAAAQELKDAGKTPDGSSLL